VDVVEFAGDLNIELLEPQVAFLKRQENKNHHFEIWPRRSGKTAMAKIMILHALSEQSDVLLLSPENHNGWQILNSIAISYKKLYPKAKVERKERGLYHFNNGVNWLKHATYDTASKSSFWKGVQPDYIHMDEYKRAPESFRDIWYGDLQTGFDKITGLSSG